MSKDIVEVNPLILDLADYDYMRSYCIREVPTEVFNDWGILNMFKNERTTYGYRSW